MFKVAFEYNGHFVVQELVALPKIGDEILLRLKNLTWISSCDVLDIAGSPVKITKLTLNTHIKNYGVLPCYAVTKQTQF